MNHLFQRKHFHSSKHYFKNDIFSQQNGAEDLRVKMENPNFSPTLTTSSTINNPPATTPTSILENIKNNETLPGGFAASIAPADMLNVWNATKLNNKNSMMMNTADGSKYSLFLFFYLEFEYF